MPLRIPCCFVVVDQSQLKKYSSTHSFGLPPTSVVEVYGISGISMRKFLARPKEILVRAEIEVACQLKVELAKFFGSAHNFSLSSASSWNLNTGDIRCDIGFSPRGRRRAKNVRAQRFLSLLKSPIEVFNIFEHSSHNLFNRIYEL